MGEETFAIARRGLPLPLRRRHGVVVGQSSGGVESPDEVEDLVEEHLGIRL